VSIEEVRALVAERQRYDDWLSALEAKRADTPLRVFERVHGDYLARRGEVLAQLQAHVGGLATLGSDLEQRLSELEGRLATHEEELAEGMLRNLVGEYDNERWETVRQEVEAKIATLGEERSVLVAEVDDVRSLLSSARVEPADMFEEPAAETESTAEESPALAPTPAVNIAVSATPLIVPALDASDDASVEPTETAVDGTTDGFLIETVEVAAPADYVVGGSMATPAAGVDSSVSDDALLDIDLQAMVDNPVPTSASHEEVLADVAALFDTSSITAVPAPAPVDSSRAPIDQAELDDALAMFGEATGPADEQFVQSLQGIQPEHDSRVDIAASAVPPVASAATSAPAANDPFDDLAFLRSVIDQGSAGDAASMPADARPSQQASAAAGSEPQKTLRCTECGTMNLPTEWYCERCGGELAAF
jgi:hypothetical protein